MNNLLKYVLISLTILCSPSLNAAESIDSDDTETNVILTTGLMLPEVLLPIVPFLLQNFYENSYDMSALETLIAKYFEELPEALRSDKFNYVLDLKEDSFEIKKIAGRTEMKPFIEAALFFAQYYSDKPNLILETFIAISSDEYYSFFELYSQHKTTIIKEYKELLTTRKSSFEPELIGDAVFNHKEFILLNQIFLTIRNVNQVNIKEVPDLEEYLNEIMNNRLSQLFTMNFIGKWYFEVLAEKCRFYVGPANHNEPKKSHANQFKDFVHKKYDQWFNKK
jgi:hypothetical protein